MHKSTHLESDKVEFLFYHLFMIYYFFSQNKYKRKGEKLPRETSQGGYVSGIASPKSFMWMVLLSSEQT
jgi:hypothetical protein